MKKRDRIAVDTLYSINNYGNLLQNYAVTVVLCELGFDPINVVNKYPFQTLLYMAYILVKKGYCEYSRLRTFYSFRKRYMKDDLIKNKINAGKKYKFVLCGSDQIWNPEWAGTPFHFATFVPPDKRISYAASFGTSEISKRRRDEYKKYLTEMKAISVREDAGARIIREISGREATILIDPTMMLYSKQWRIVSKKPKFIPDKKYVLTYFLGDKDSEKDMYIQGICDKYGYELIKLEEMSHNMYWYKTGPSEFLWLIDHCELLCTDSFHGSVFSILLDKPFIVFDRTDKNASMNSRIDTLLSKLELNHKRFSNQSYDHLFDHNYGHVEAILGAEREKATRYLKTSLNIS